MHFPGQEHLPPTPEPTPDPAPTPRPPAGSSGNSSPAAHQFAVNRRANALRHARKYLVATGHHRDQARLLELAKQIDDFLATGKTPEKDDTK